MLHTFCIEVWDGCLKPLAQRPSRIALAEAGQYAVTNFSPQTLAKRAFLRNDVQSTKRKTSMGSRRGLSSVGLELLDDGCPRHGAVCVHALTSSVKESRWMVERSTGGTQHNNGEPLDMMTVPAEEKRQKNSRAPIPPCDLVKGGQASVLPTQFLQSPLLVHTANLAMEFE